MRTKILMSALLAVALSAGATPACAHDGPHGGELYCDGNHNNHAELVVDKQTGKATVYILDKKGKKEFPIAAKSIVIRMKGVERPLQLAAVQGKNGQASQYSVQHQRFSSKFKPSDIKMEIVITEGKPAITFTPEHDDDE